jgi:hypothetical protein
MSAWCVLKTCERCAAAHGPWGVHAGDGATVYEIWVTETGSVESALTVCRDVGVSERMARRRFASRLERFINEEHRLTLRRPTVALHLEFDATTESGPGYGPLAAPEHLYRSLGELIDLALEDLSARS